MTTPANGLGLVGTEPSTCWLSDERLSADCGRSSDRE